MWPMFINWLSCPCCYRTLENPWGDETLEYLIRDQIKNIPTHLSYLSHHSSLNSQTLGLNINHSHFGRNFKKKYISHSLLTLINILKTLNFFLIFCFNVSFLVHTPYSPNKRILNDLKVVYHNWCSAKSTYCALFK